MLDEAIVVTFSIDSYQLLPEHVAVQCTGLLKQLIQSLRLWSSAFFPLLRSSVRTTFAFGSSDCQMKLLASSG